MLAFLVSDPEDWKERKLLSLKSVYTFQSKYVDGKSGFNALSVA